MARFSLDEGTSGGKRKNRSNEEEEDLKKRTCGRDEGETSVTSEEEEEEESDEVGDEGEDGKEMEKTVEDGGNTDGEFNFRIDPDVLDCSICFEPLRPPIFQCRNGHIACSYCCPKLLNKCHSCCQHIGRRRCLALEKVIESIMSPCQYANYGCRAILPFVQKASHEEACSHAALFCPISDCTFSGSKSLLAIHAKRKHSNILKNLYYDQPFFITLDRWQPFMVLLGEDNHFFLLLNRYETDAGSVLSVICMASNNPEYEFSYELRLDSRGSSLQLKTKAEKVKKWNGVYPNKAFLVVPGNFYTSGELSISVCIYKSSAMRQTLGMNSL